MKQLIEIPQHTIVMTIGPSNSGKSYLMTDVLIPNLLLSNGIRHRYLSSDNIRRTLIGAPLHKHDPKMMAVSRQAFNLLYTELETYTSYPVNTPVVIVDATNLSKISRSKVLEIAKKNHYNVVALVFDYKDMDDYVKYTDEDTNKRVIFDMVKTLRQTTLKEIDRSDYKAVHKITSNDFSNITFTYSSGEGKSLFVNHKNVCFVGDVHGCYEEFIACLQDNKGIIVDAENMTMTLEQDAIETGKYIHHILIGDLVDKGPDSAKVVEFVHKNRDFFIIVEGNHDRWVYNYLTKKIKANPDNDHLIANWFDSVRVFEQDEVAKQQFLELYESMYTFVYNDKFIATHAPCENKFLGKTDKVSLKKQNHIMYPKKADYPDMEGYMAAREEFFNFLVTDSEIHFPIHVFGHVMLKQVFQNKNKYGIDTGLVAGGALSTLILLDENKKPFVRKYKSTRPVKEELYPLFRVRTNDVEIGGLEPDLANRLRWCARNQVNFVSGTMSPCDKDFEAGDLESLKKGIEYYKERGVKGIILQPKFMGSRCNIMLHKDDVEKCKAISRNAYEIKEGRITANRTLAELFKELQTNLAWAFKEYNAEYILFDGELLPWNAMGKELIERDFMLAYKACSAELDILRETGFEELRGDFETKYANVETTELKPHEVAMKKTYDAFNKDILHTDEMQVVLDKYKHQLDVFGNDGNLEFKPFAILKIYRADGSEENWVSSEISNVKMFGDLSSDPYMTIGFEANDWKIFNLPTVGSGTIEQALEYFWRFITEQKEMEGLVLKPALAYVPGVAPFIKCRNKEYLRLTYGFDYDALPTKTERLLKTKSIKRKMETSIKEYELARKLLDVPLKDISTENKMWLSLMVQMLSEQDREKELDPRL